MVLFRGSAFSQRLNARKREKNGKKKKTPRDRKRRKRTAKDLDSRRGVRGRALSTYRMHRRLLGPPTTFATGWTKDGLEFVLLTFSSGKHSARRDRPLSRSSRRAARVRIREEITARWIENGRGWLKWRECEFFNNTWLITWEGNYIIECTTVLTNCAINRWRSCFYIFSQLKIFSNVFLYF